VEEEAPYPKHDLKPGMKPGMLVARGRQDAVQPQPMPSALNLQRLALRLSTSLTKA
jgi:hypothetical protein